MGGHSHAFTRRVEYRCVCGIALCGSQSPYGWRCNQEKGHCGDCLNTGDSRRRTWKVPFEREPEAPSMKIVVTGQNDQYRASLDGHKGSHGTGKTPNEAIGNLVTILHGVFQVTVERETPS